MAWQDRDYYRENGNRIGNPLNWLLYGSVPLFRLFGIHVRAHAALVIMAALAIIFGMGESFTWSMRIQSATILFVVILLHEFGHCFTARWVGGEADEIIMHPLGGLALTRPPHRPLPMFLTVAGGPAVNVLICLISGLALWMLGSGVDWPWNPFLFHKPPGDTAIVLYFTYGISWGLLIFNLLPIFPLDGGQMVQAILWPKMGYIRSMNLSCMIGMIAAGLLFPVALVIGNFFMAMLSALGFITCMGMRRQLREAGPWGMENEADYSSSLRPEPHHRKRHISPRSFKRARRRELAERNEQARVDAILAKVSSHGLQSLSWRERRVLRKATERQRDLDTEPTPPAGR